MKQGAAEKIAVIQVKIKELQKQISEIRNQCSHVWEKVKLPDLKETLVAGVYVGRYEGSIAVPEPTDTNFKCVCKKCKKDISDDITQTCPNCLVKLKDEERYTGGSVDIRNRKDYFGKDYSYYGVYIKACPKCNFQVACDIYDR
ncbi:MAG: hypothetical protein AAB345_04050 [Patescibacteria group bacterium]